MEIGVLVGILVVFLLGLKLAFAETNYNDTVGALNYFISSSQLSCNLLFDSGETEDKHVILCEDLVNFLEQKCRDNYYDFCFGNQWNNEQQQQFKNPDFCSKVDC